MDDGYEIISPIGDGALFAPAAIKQEDIDIGEEELRIEPTTSHDPLSLNPRSVKREAYAAAGASRARRDQANGESDTSSQEDDYDQNSAVSPTDVSIELDIEPEPVTNLGKASFKRARVGVRFNGLYKCPTCGKQFATSSMFRRHERTHSGVKYPCRYCPVLLGSSSSLHRHQRGHTGFKPFSCVTCNKQFPGRSEFWKHRVTCKGASNLPTRMQPTQPLKQPSQPKMKHYPLACKVCNMPFSNKVGLLAHMTTHNRTCRWCKRSFSSRIGLSNHMKVHATYGRSSASRSRKYRCKLCPQVFANWSQVVKHRVIHVNNESLPQAHHNSAQVGNTKKTVAHTCKVCSETFGSWRDLIIHQKCHSRQMPIKGELAPTASHAAGQKPRRYYCRACPDYFKSWYDLVKHRKEHANKDQVSSNMHLPRTLPNPLSKQKLAVGKIKAGRKAGLSNRNIESPSLNGSSASDYAGPPSRNYASPGYCHVCGYDCRTSCALDRHSAKHTNLKRYSCYVCSARMKYATSVQNHLKTVHGVFIDHRSIKPDATYDTAQSKILAQLTKPKNVKLEVNRNTPSPNNTCRLCDEVFPTQKLLFFHHQQNHKDTKQFSCDSCPQMFMSKGNLVRHIQLYHSRTPHQLPAPSLKTENHALFSCTVCGVRFSSKKSWKNHQRLKKHWDTSQIKIRIYSCTECSNSYNSAAALHSHKTTEHVRVPAPLVASTEQDNAWTCQLCTRTFKSNMALKIHTIRSHKGSRKTKFKKVPALKGPTNRTLHECDLCGKAFQNENAVKTHRGWHSRHVGGKVLKSEQNNADKTTNTSIISTDSTGLVEGDDVDGKSCSLCDRIFSTVQACKMHYQWHMKTPKSVPVSVTQTEPKKKNNTEQICQLCGKSFYRAKAFEIHYNWHMRNPSSLPTSAPSSALVAAPVSSPVSTLDSDLDSGNEMQEQNKELPCHICGKPFYSSRALKVHHTWHLKTPSSLPTTPALIQDGENTCQLCGKSFTNKKSFKIHYGWHLRIPSSASLSQPQSHPLPSPTLNQPQSKPVATVQLKQEFVNTRSSIERSVPDANDFGEFECEFCDKSCATVQALRCHMGWHTRQGLALPPKTKGTVIEERFATPSQEIPGGNINTDSDGRFTCNVCDQSFSSAKACISHQGWHTRGEADKNFSCEYCHHRFASRGNLAKHKRLSCPGYVQNGNPRSVERGYVPRTPVVTTSSSRPKKKEATTGKGDFSCDICHKAFKYLKAVGTHKIMQHSNETQPSVPTASISIATTPLASPLEQGECTQFQPQANGAGSQTGSNKRFSCDVCSQRFIGQKALTIHRNLHFRSFKAPSRMKPFRNMDQTHSCTICHKTFNSRVTLSRHRQEHVRQMFRKPSKMSANKVKHNPFANDANTVESQQLVSEIPVESDSNSTINNIIKDPEANVPEDGGEGIDGLEENGMLIDLEPTE